VEEDSGEGNDDVVASPGDGGVEDGAAEDGSEDEPADGDNVFGEGDDDVAVSAGDGAAEDGAAKDGQRKMNPKMVLMNWQILLPGEMEVRWINCVVNAGEVKAGAMEEVRNGSYNFSEGSTSDSSTD